MFSKSLFLIVLFALSQVSAKCALPDHWQTTVSCEGGSVKHMEGTGIHLECPSGIPANSDGIVLTSTHKFTAIGFGDATMDQIVLADGSDTVKPFAALRATSDDNHVIEASWNRHGAGNAFLAVELLDASGTRTAFDSKPVPDEDNGIEIHIKRGVSDIGHAADDVDVEVDSYAEDLYVNGTWKWSSQDYTVAVVLGNHGSDPVTGASSFVLESLADVNGEPSLKGTVFCTLHGFANTTTTASGGATTTTTTTVAGGGEQTTSNDDGSRSTTTTTTGEAPADASNGPAEPNDAATFSTTVSLFSTFVAAAISLLV